MTSFILCADDFGLKETVNHAIIELVRDGRINAVSAMAPCKALDEGAEALLAAAKEAPGKVEIGLHLTMTQYEPLGPVPSLASDGFMPSIGKLLVKTYLSKVQRAEIEEEFSRQIERFKTAFGRAPDFIDGHEHAHLLPIIRDVVQEYITQNFTPDHWVRTCHSPIREIAKTGNAVSRALIIAQLSKSLKSYCQGSNIMTNSCFFGVNGHEKSEDFGLLMRRWLDGASRLGGRPLIMCHPAVEGDEPAIFDPISARRLDEFKYLSSDRFIADMNETAMHLFAE